MKTKREKIIIPYGRQDITNEDIDAVTEVLTSDFLTQGPVLAKFEKAVSAYCNSQHAIAVNSGTSALHIACLSLGVSQGDIVWTSANTFSASSNCALYCGATIDFIDIHPLSFNICINDLEEKLLKARKKNLLPKVIIPVHLAGQSADMKKIFELGKEYGFKIIEDASHAIGGSYLEDKIGSCRYSDITVFSFHPVKIITTGEGGMALTNDSSLASSMNLLRSHGITRDQKHMIYESHGPWYYEQIDLGFNYRMTDIQAALGLSQFKRIDKYIGKRNNIADKYDNFLENLPFKLPYRNPDCYSSFHLYILRIDLAKVKKPHKEIFKFLRKKDVLSKLALYASIFPSFL